MKVPVYLILILSATLIVAGCAPDVRQAPLAEDGVLDLTSWDFNRDGSVKLNGEWAFYWRQLLDPEAFSSASQLPPDGMFTVPGTWNNYTLDGKPLGRDGAATFRLKVRWTPDDTPKAVRILNLSTAYTLWINGRPVARNGTVGEARETTTPQFLLQEASFFADGTEMDIVLQMANFSHRKGGVWNPIQLGTTAQIQNRHNLQWIFDLSLFGCLLIMSLYHFSLYLLHKEDLSPLYFAVFTLVIAVRVLVSGNYYLSIVYPTLPWEVMYMIELLSVVIPLPVLALFVSSLYKKQRSVLALRMICGMGIIFSLAILATPAKISGQLVLPNQILILAILGYVLFVLVRAALQRERGALIILCGIVAFACMALVDILVANRIIYTIQFVPFGVVLLVFSQSFVLTYRFANAFKRVKLLSGELESRNISLKRMDRIKDEFIANTSHELRTPLSGIIGLAESIKEDASGKSSGKSRHSLELIIASGRRLSGLINDLLDISLIRNRELRLNKGPVDIRALTVTVLEVSKPLIKGKDLVLKNQIPSNLPYVHGDELRLQQILYNLVGNAIKFTDRGEVTVTAEQKNAMIEVSITDTGIGIDEENLDAIFKSFKQVQASASRRYGGTGLGLAITRNLVALHRGTVGVTSTPKRGSTFYFTTPVSTDVPEADKGMPMAESALSAVEDGPLPILPDNVTGAAGDKEHTILVVDDDPINLQVVVNQLSFMGDAGVHTAMGGQEALEWIEANPCPDLVLLDIMMPDITGYEVCRTLRREYSASRLPVIILTAKNRVTDLAEGFACGANDYLSKPFARDELLARVKTQLDLKRSYQALEENLKLKKEIEQRKLTELDLRVMQKRLSRILDTLDDAVIAVNTSGEISFCNAPWREMLGYETEALLGQSVIDLFPEDVRPRAGGIIERMVDADLRELPRPLETLILLDNNGTQVACQTLFAQLDIDHDPLLVMVMQRADRPAGRQSGQFDQGAAILLIDELNKNRLRIQALEDALSDGIARQDAEAARELKKLDATLAQMEKILEGKGEALGKKRLGARVMTLSLEYWQQSAGATKADLASQSRLWKVYRNKDGFERTQTLDKYLDIGQFPKRPRWNQVFKTADFVLAACQAPSPLRDELETTVSTLRMLN